MTIKELYIWAIKHDCLDKEIEIQYRDDGGYYQGTEPLEETLIAVKDDCVIF